MFKLTKNNAVRAVVLLCALLIGSTGFAVAQDVRYNYVPGTDFSKYKTYKWAEVQGGQHPDQMISDQIKAAIDSQLAAKGLTKTEGDQVDLFVAYQVAVQQEKQWNAMATGPGVRWGGMGTATSTTIQIGTLVVDLYDASTKKQVWRGDATKTLNPSKDPVKNQERLQKAVAKLMQNYPPKPKK